MMVMLRGEVVYRGDGFVILENGGVGHKIVLPDADTALEASGEMTYFIHEVIRDSERELFGFSTVAALELFWKLISISGVGPRSAQKIIYADHIDQVRGKIMTGNLEFLTGVPGIGKKTAQKIILELKGVLAEYVDASSFDSDAIDALVALGYSKKDAEQVLSGIEGESTEDRIRQALRSIAR